MISDPDLVAAVRKANGNDVDAQPRFIPELIAQRASDVVIEPVEWLWPARVAIGKQTLIAGEAGLGKSQLSIGMIAAVTTAGAWPCNEGRAPLGSVIILSAEDGAADTVVPRLMAAGADLERVCLIRAVRGEDGKGRRAFNLLADLELLERKIVEIGDVKLIVIDPISAYLGPKIDSHVNAAVRGALEPVGELAGRLRVAVVSITHPPKGTGATAINRFIGSIAFVAAARAAFMVTRDPDNEDRRLFLPVKNNLAPMGQGLAFRLEQRIVGDESKGIVASSVVWDGEPVAISVDQALQATDAGNDDRSATAENFLLDLLSGGEEIAAVEIKREAQDAGMAWATVRRAQKRLGIKPCRRVKSGDGLGGRGHWYWSLPAGVGRHSTGLSDNPVAPDTPPSAGAGPLRCSPSPYDAHLLEVSTLGKNEHLRRPEPTDDYPELPACLRRAPPQETSHAPALEPADDNLDAFQ
jgi:putative DNA primase/helicase